MSDDFLLKFVRVIGLLGLIHALTISSEFARYEPLRLQEPDKFLLATVTVLIVLLFSLWRISAAHRNLAARTK